MKPTKNIAFLALAAIGLSMPAANAQYNGFSINNSTQPYQNNRIWNNPNGGLTRREVALLQKLNRQISALEARLRLRGVSFRERTRLNNQLRDLRWQLSRLRHDNRRY